jgi:hypothetical protein
MTESQYDFDFMTTNTNITSITSGGTVGSVLSTTLSGPTWTNSTITATAQPYTYGYNDTYTINTPKTLTVKGVKLSERLDEIEKRLAILRPNNDLENRWEELKELGERYRELEKEILGKEHVWDILKK